MPPISLFSHLDRLLFKVLTVGLLMRSPSDRYIVLTHVAISPLLGSWLV